MYVQPRLHLRSGAPLTYAHTRAPVGPRGDTRRGQIRSMAGVHRAVFAAFWRGGTR